MIKNRFITFLILLPAAGILSAQTTIDQELIDGAVWTAAGSPYHITLNVEIADLQIDPGVSVLFDGPYKFEVTGNLDAEGFYSDSIYFKPAPENSSGWEGISLLSNEFSSALSYCRIEGALDQGLLINSSESPEIFNCRIVNNTGSGLLVQNSSIELKNCFIADNTNHGIILDQAQVTIFNSIISRNQEAGISSTEAQDEITLTNSVIADNERYGIRSASGSVTVRNSILFDNAPSELFTDKSKTQISYSTIGDNTIYTGEGNINDDPLFTDRVSYALTETSPCIDRGNPDTAFNDKFFPPSFGESRNDMGAYGGPDAGNWYAPLRIIPESINFGDVTRDSSKVMALVIKNYRNYSLSVSDVIVNPAFLSVDKNSFTVPASGSISLNLTFTPGQTDEFFANLILHTNGYGIVSTPISGRGVVPLIGTKPGSFSFGKITTGTSDSLFLYIENWGLDTLRIQNIYTTNTVFTVNKPSFNIKPGYAIDSVQITFAPDSAISYQDSLIILSNDPDKHRTALPLSGSGEDGPLLQVTPPDLNFGSVLAKTDSTLQLQVKNRGDLLLSISDITLNVPDSAVGAFQLQNKPATFPVELSADSSFLLSITFAPLQTGTDAAGIVFTSNDFFNTQDTVFLNGKGVAPDLALSANQMDFDSLDVGRDSLITIEIINSGDAALKIYSFSISGQDTVNPVFSFSPDERTFPIEIAPSASFLLPVYYAPRGSGADDALLQIAHNDPFKEQVTVALHGYGLASRIESSVSQLDFGSIPFNADSVLKFTVYNRGEKALLVFSDSLKFSAEAAAFFSFNKPIMHDLSLAPGDSASFLIRFKPLNMGIKNGILYLSCNDPIHANISIPLSGTGTDIEPAAVTFDAAHSSPAFTFNSSAVLSFEITAPAGIDSAFLYLRKGGESSFRKTALTRQDQSNNWQMPVEAARVTERGLEYCVQTYHGFRQTLSPDNGFIHPAFIPVTVQLLPFPELTKEKAYQHISIPLNTKGQTLSTLFEDDLGKYDNENYRIFDYSEDSGFIEIKNLDITLPPGKALWLVTKDALTLDVENSVSVSSSDPYELPLKKGWNMIAAPFAFSSSWTEAVPNYPLNYYDGNGWTFSTSLTPFKGYAVYMKQDTSVFILPTENGTTAVMAKTGPFIDGETWHIQLQVESGNYKDHFNFAGVHPNASDGEDRFDYREPPVVGKYVSLYFSGNENQKHFTSDYRSGDEDGYTFLFEVSGNTRQPKRIQLAPHNLPSGFDWAVFSPETGVRYDKEQIQTSRNRQRFVLVAGSKEFIAAAAEGYTTQPLSFRLSQNYPNPFNPQTVAKYQLPTAERVSVEVYNILGQRIKTLLKNETQDAGYYQIKWNGTDASGSSVSAGIYFLHLRSKNFSKTVKMIFQK